LHCWCYILNSWGYFSHTCGFTVLCSLMLLLCTRVIITCTHLCIYIAVQQNVHADGISVLTFQCYFKTVAFIFAICSYIPKETLHLSIRFLKKIKFVIRRTVRSIYIFFSNLSLIFAALPTRQQKNIAQKKYRELNVLYCRFHTIFMRCRRVE
jgi:hypothetical protein